MLPQQRQRDAKEEEGMKRRIPSIVSYIVSELTSNRTLQMKGTRKRKLKSDSGIDFYNMEVPGMEGYASPSESEDEAEIFEDEIHVGSQISWYGKLSFDHEMDATAHSGTILTISGSGNSAAITVRFGREKRSLTSQNTIRLLSVANAAGEVTELTREESNKRTGALCQFSGLVEGIDNQALNEINNSTVNCFKKVMRASLNTKNESGMLPTDFLQKQFQVGNFVLSSLNALALGLILKLYRQTILKYLKITSPTQTLTVHPKKMSNHVLMLEPKLRPTLTQATML